MRLLARSIVAAAAIFATVMSTGTAAHAAETVLNLKHQYLIKDPFMALPASHFERDIWLDPGTYGFFHWVKPDARPVPGKPCYNWTGHLQGNAWYRWHSDLGPMELNGQRYYILYTRITNLTTGSIRDIECNIFIPHDGNYDWGSGLDPHF